MRCATEFKFASPAPSEMVSSPGDDVAAFQSDFIFRVGIVFSLLIRSVSGKPDTSL
jgi:hypothetical protein